ncbi:MAG: 16S rRNA (cytidine(1402)-2'-O)-methyltransferase, partial [Flavobacteriales bacterium]|nr:16S rRNA (cytidine(1402)-2'-O)-methyltransferase [Flavobacteriales bacterium]
MCKLYLVPTPIGNLQDITLRAVEVLKDSDFILAEDSRHTSKLLKHLEIEKKVVPHHQHNEHKTVNRIIEQLSGGATIALVTDAGTPGISDPGFLLLRECIKNDVAIECLPGATAFVPALVNSGLPIHNFIFEGFLPHKKGKQKKLIELIEEQRTMVFYESPFRLVKTLGDFATHFGAQRR